VAEELLAGDDILAIRTAETVTLTAGDVSELFEAALLSVAIAVNEKVPGTVGVQFTVKGPGATATPTETLLTRKST
jgi:hypothetical protein